MTRTEIYDTLDEVENKLLEVRDRLDIDEIGDDTDYADINNAIEAALAQVQSALQAADHKRFGNR